METADDGMTEVPSHHLRSSESRPQDKKHQPRGATDDGASETSLTLSQINSTSQIS